MLAEIWTGCKCPNGETWNVGITYEQDIENDKEYEIHYCAICMSTNIVPKIINGGHCMHVTTEDEMFWEHQNESESYLED